MFMAGALGPNPNPNRMVCAWQEHLASLVAAMIYDADVDVADLADTVIADKAERGLEG